MRTLVFLASIGGLIGASVLAYVANITEATLPPAFNPATNPYPHGIYANGILESAQPSGSNINIFPEVAGTVARILVSEGQAVEAVRRCWRWTILSSAPRPSSCILRRKPRSPFSRNCALNRARKRSRWRRPSSCPPKPR